MPDTTETAIYRLSYDPGNSAASVKGVRAEVQGLAGANDGLSVSEEKVSRATRTREDAMQRLLARLDPHIRAEQQLARVQEQVSRLQLEGIGSTREAAQALALAEQRFLATGEAVSLLGSRFLSLGRVMRAFTLGAVILQTVRAGENLVKNFDSIEQHARSLGIQVDAGLGEKMRRVRTDWDKSWTEMQIAVAPVVAMVARLVELLTLLPRGVGAALSDIGRGSSAENILTRENAGPARTPMSMRDRAAGAGIPLATNSQYLEMVRERAKTEEAERKKAVEARLKFQEELQAKQDEGYQHEAEALQQFHDKRQDLIDQADADEAEALQQFHEEEEAAWDRYYENETKALDEFHKDADEAWGRYYTRQQQRADQIHDQIQSRAISDLADLGTTALFSSDDAGQAFLKMTQSLAQYIVKLELAHALENSLGSPGGGDNPLGLIGRFLGIGGGGVSDAVAITPQVFGSNPGGFVGTFADGGYIPPGSWGIAGERGPEPVYGGHTGATVMPGHGAVTLNIYQTVSGNGDAALAAATRASAAAAYGKIKNDLLGLMREAQERHG